MVASNQVAPDETDEMTFETVNLLKLESSMGHMMSDGITTITFFTGDATTGATLLRARFAEVAAANPWLTGTIIDSPDGKLKAIRFATDGAKASESCFEVNESLQVSPEQKYDALVKAIGESSAKVIAGSKLQKQKLPVTKLTVVPGGGGFSVIFSISHVVCNGGGYYHIFNMLGGSEIKALSPVRKEDCHSRLPEFVGVEEEKFIKNGLNFNFLGELLCHKKETRRYCFLLDDEKVKAAKETRKGDAPFVSTNDIITSGFGNVADARLMIMATEFTGKIEGLERSDVGNYHNALLLDSDGFGTPSAIRNALSGPAPMSRVAKLPGGCCCCGEAASMTVAMVTNWAGFAGGMSIEGCEQTLHVPVVGLDFVAGFAATAIVFKPRPGQTAMLMFVKGPTEDDLKAELPLGEMVSQQMFE